ncbi:hypothetical protein [Thalassobellus suaedae]|uniref:Uncharacterized protein n=1 Tax=Thalassobellus suaedae TaxID=3074124 RepID=A0ABY9Y3P2_9FLAO|nr:hypothetical protein RHP49_00405 [Flavobacteriaceae bacterium HL-DH10]
MIKYTLENIESFIDKNPILTAFFSNDELTDYYKKWRINNGVLFHDYLWLLFNNALIKNGDNFGHDENEELFYRNNYLLYYSMAHFKREEGGDTESINQLLRLAFESQIQEFKISSNGSRFESEGIVIMKKGCCDYYDSISDIKFKFDDFTEHCHIATHRCNDKYGFCRCCLGMKPKRDVNGHLVKKNVIN